MKRGTVNVLESFPSLSVTLIVILLYPTPVGNVSNVIVLFPTAAFVVNDDAPVIVIVPALVVEKV